ncbi:MAG: nucleotidyltransferase domain-containing protein [bacterium]
MFNFLKNGKGAILNLMFLNPDKEYYLAEISKILGQEPSHYQKYITDLIAEGVLNDKRLGNMRLFWLNKDYQLYNELKNIVAKTIGLEAELKIALQDVETIATAFIFGSFATDKFNSHSDIDLLLIGVEDQQNTVIKKITELENKIGRSINYHLYSHSEILKKIDIKDDFIYNIFHREIIILKGNINEFTKSK